MFVILITISSIALTRALNPAENVELANDKTKNIINKYLTNIPDIEERYIVDERLSGAISRFFKGKISSFPLYKISLKIDRNPVKIPWTLGDAQLEEPEQNDENRHVQKRYKYQKHVNGQDVRNIKFHGDISNKNSMEATAKIKNRSSSKTSGKTVKNKGSLNLPEEPDTSKNTKNIDATKVLKELDKSRNTKYIDATKVPEQADKSKNTKNLDAAKVPEEPDKNKKIRSVKLSKNFDKTENKEAGKSAKLSQEPDKIINKEFSKMSEEPNKSKNVEAGNPSEQPDKSENILSTTDYDDLSETTESTTIIKLA